MEERNCTTAAQFILLGLPDQPELKLVVLLMFLTIYVTILVGNLTMVTLIEISPQVHSHMYFFLRNLSLVVAVYSSGIVSKVLINYLLETKVISFGECVVQFFFLSFFASMEFFLATMAYDRFIAVCHPLLYTVIMSKEVCILLGASSYLLSCLSAVVHTSSLFRLLFGSFNIINNFFCDIPPLHAIYCSDIYIANLVHFVFTTLVLIITIVAILFSYVYIVVTILRIHSAEGRCKVFSTCASHITVVFLLYGTLFFIYTTRSTSTKSLDQGKMVSVFFTLVIPMYNPLIYSLRNKEVKEALKKTKSGDSSVSKCNQ
ncbi:olfactory receptor 1052-like [Tachyglossus aculeatus]|uniref:olfactory receptor 1052-like n=1 Tax=Tachyglossus aculeatus TaxID=9261 RepID=UPI0018F3A1E3|nr:olfactory receptor 1052-like [Tachyglossus aculeatus]